MTMLRNAMLTLIMAGSFTAEANNHTGNYEIKKCEHQCDVCKDGCKCEKCECKDNCTCSKK